MKSLLILFALIQTSLLNAQTFQPFKSSQPKRFENIDNLNSNHFFYSTYESVSGDTVINLQYLRESDNTIDVSGTSCEGWGGSIVPTVDTTWLGREIKYNALTKELIVENNTNEILAFDFNLPLGDSSLFYQNSSYNYYLRNDGFSEEFVIDSLDWVKTFTLWKFDLFDNIEPSVLNGFEIKLSENYGLISFIECNQFPLVEARMILKGQLYPTIGYYQLTMDEIFPWQVGDTLQTKGIISNMNWGTGTISHKIFSIQNRVETSDSVWIYLTIDEQVDYTPYGATNYPSPYNISYDNPIVFKKGDNISDRPNNMIDYEGITTFNDSADFCGYKSRYHITGEFINYCEDCDCFTPYDGFGNSILTNTYISGMGQTHKSVNNYGPITQNIHANLIYSKINGVECGDFAPLNLSEKTINLKLYPNPVKDLLFYEINEKIEGISVSNLQGKNQEVSLYDGYIDLSILPQGCYFILFNLENGQTSNAIVIKD